MAPALAASAGPLPKQLRPTAPRRIVPAIPRRLARPLPSARPLTPEESNKGAVTQQDHEPGPPPASLPPPHALAETLADASADDQQPSAAQTPPTPDSRASVAAKSEVDAERLHMDPAAPGDTKLAIPVELPPPFYPSSRADLLMPPAAGGAVAHAQSHRHQLSAGAVVFRSTNDAPATPATPLDTDLDVRTPQQSSGRPPPGFAPPLATPFLAGQSSHVPTAAAPWLHPQYSVAPSDPAYANGGGYESPPFPEGLPAYSSAYNVHFSPKDAAFAFNGVAGSHAQSPSKSQFSDTKPGSDQGEEQRLAQHQNGSAPLAERLEESPFELAAYLSTQFGNIEFADVILQIRSPDSVLVSIPVHSIVVVRSPVIADAIRRSPASGHRSRDARQLVDVHAQDPLVTRESLEEAIKVLYGAPLLSPQTFLYGLGAYAYENVQASTSSDAGRRMQQVLSYIAAARLLQMPSMQARGVEIARMLLRWDTIDQVLHYGLQTSTASRPRTEGPDTDDPFTSALLNYAIDFMAYTFPVDFRLYTFAPELQNGPRLTTLAEPRTSTHNPRLSKIQFGDAPPEYDLQPSHATRVLSTLLLSLPHPLIERLFNHRATANQIGWTGAVRIMRDLINERENRRQKAHQGQLKPPHDGMIPAPRSKNMYIEERVEQVEPSRHYPSGHRLATRTLAGEN